MRALANTFMNVFVYFYLFLLRHNYNTLCLIKELSIFDWKVFTSPSKILSLSQLFYRAWIFI